MIVRGYPDPEFVQGLERVGVDYELAGCVVFEEDPDWRCRAYGHEWIEGRSEPV